MSVRPLDLIATGAAALRTRRLRAVLSAGGVAIGVAAMVAVVGISTSSRARLIDELDRLGTDLLTVGPGETFFGDDATLPASATAMVRRIGPVRAAAATATLDAAVYRHDRVPTGETGGIAVRAADVGLLATLEGSLRRGSYLNDATGRYPAVVLGAVAATRLGIDVADGTVLVWLGDQWFAVVGILESLPLAPEIDRSALVGFDVAAARLGHDGAPTTIYARTAPDAVDAVRSVLAATASPAHPEEVRVSRPSDALAARAAANLAFTALLLGLGAVGLLVGAVGIANVMVIAVLERRREIGLRRALGATRRHVRLQFLAEAVLLAATGGVAGAAAGGLVTVAYAAVRGWPAVVPAAALAVAVAASVVVGAVAGLWPAARAARLSPTEALRST